MRSIAAHANVSPMTVSLALRNDPSLPLATRERIQRAARAEGYRPDPMLTHLMQHLRTSRTARSAVNLAVVTTHDAPFVHRLIAGATARADRLGYTLDRSIDLRTFAKKPAALTRTLLARGIAGVLLAPAQDPTDYSTLLDWKKFAAVAMTYSIFEPRVHRVVTHHFDNAVRTFALLEQRGFERIGLAMTRDMEFRANHSYSGAYFRTAAGGRKLAPILFLDAMPRRAIQTWFDRHRPQAIVVANAHQVRANLLPALGAQRCQRTAFACLDYEAGPGIAGIDQLFETIGSHALDALVAQIHRHERGLPENPTIGMVEGQWTEPNGLFLTESAATRPR